jgi:hypothetical protein
MRTRIRAKGESSAESRSLSLFSSRRLPLSGKRQRFVSLELVLLGVTLLGGTLCSFWLYGNANSVATTTRKEEQQSIRSQLSSFKRNEELEKQPLHSPINNTNNHLPTDKELIERFGNNFSAVSLLAQPLEQPWVVHRLAESGEALVESPHTIVTAYFRLKSKYSKDKYDEWMTNILSLQDPMVIFTQPDMVATISKFRNEVGPRGSTVIIECQLHDLPIAYMNHGKHFSRESKNGNHTNLTYWQYQLEIDPEKRRHQSYELFWIWLSKAWFVQQAIDQNYFSSQFFMWSDIGCFRKKGYNGKKIIESLESIDEVVPDRQTLLWLAHHPPNPPPNYLWTNKLGQKPFFFHSGSQGAGYAEAWTKFLAELSQTLDDFSALFVGEDQCMLQATCLRRPDLCAYIPSDQVYDNSYFGLRHVLHHPKGARGNGGEYKLWRPPVPTAGFLNS